MAKKIASTLVIGIFFVFGMLSSVQAIEVGVAWEFGKSGMTERVTKGFAAGMKEFGQNVNVEFHKDLSSFDELAAVVDRYQKEKQGMVILRSNGAEWLGKNPPTIPTFIGGCNHPVELGALKDMQAPEGNITGVTYFLPAATQFETFKAILPNMKSVLLLTEAGHPSSAINREETQAVTRELGLAYYETAVSSKEEAVEAVKAYADKVSLVILGSQAVVTDNAKAIVEAAGKLPTVSYTSKPVQDGALGGFVTDDETLGYMLAQSLVDVLVKGKAVKDVPVKVDPRPTFYINVKTAERLGLEIPYQVLQIATVIE